MLLPSILLAASALAGAEGTNDVETAPAVGIAWYGTLEQGLAEAKRSGRAILLQSAAPQCRGVPGMW